MCILGKPVAVTHSKGNAQVRERPGTDIEYEKAQWKRSTLKIRKGPGKGDAANFDPETDSYMMKV